MTPLEIEILMHYYTRGLDYRNGDFTGPAVRDAIDRFVDLGLLYAGEDTEGPEYIGNRKALAVYVNAICSVPLPVLTWAIPQPPNQEQEKR